MKKGALFFVLSLFLIIQLVSAIQVQKEDKGSVIISELNNPAIFEFKITSPGTDNCEIYSLLDVSFSPRGTFDLVEGENIIEVKAYPGSNIRKNLGFYKFEYQIKCQKSGIFNDFLTVRIVELQSVITINGAAFKPSDSNLTINVINKENTHIEELNLVMKSAFFEEERTISLEPKQELPISIAIDKKKSSSLLAGKYVITSTVQLGQAKAKTEGIIDYMEENNISVDKSSSGFIIRKTLITKTNTGNIPTKATIDVNKDILSRLFTSYSIEPMASERSGLNVKYVWEKALNPGEALIISASTNYTLPLVILILIILVVVFTKIYALQAVSVEKRVSYVRSKSGLALKVTLHVKARKYVDNIQIIDQLPAMTKLYEKYGKLPERIDHASRRLFWNIQKLNTGEERVFSYIIYSNLNIVGRFELPAASAIFEREGKNIEVFSNRAFFAINTAKRETY